MSGKRILAGAVIVAAVLGTAGCGKAADKLSEKAVEKGIEAQSGGKVDIDGNKVKITGKDGEVSYEADGKGNVKITGKDGESSSTYGDGAKLPNGWPAVVKLPADLKLTSSSTNSTSDGKTMMVMAESSIDVKKMFEDFKSQLEKAGFDITGESMTESDGSSYGSLQADNGKLAVNVSVSGAGTGTDKNVVLVNVGPSTS